MRPTAQNTQHEPVQTIADDISGNVRNLLARRQVARDQALDYRRRGLLVPGSLGEEIAEIRADLERALERYTAVKGT